MKVLELGCGRPPNQVQNSPDCPYGKADVIVHLDRFGEEGVDVVHDIEKFPYPFKDGEFDEVYASHILEHTRDLEGILKEISRVTKDRGTLRIKVPYFSSATAFANIDHKRFFTYDSFLRFQPGALQNWEVGSLRFRIKRSYLNFTIYGNRWANSIVNPVVNLSPRLYQRFFAFVLPCDEVQFDLEVLK